MQSQPSHYCWLQHSQVPVWRDICQKQKREKNLNIIQENHPKVEIFNFHSMAVAETWCGMAGRRQADHPTIMPFIISTHQMLMVLPWSTFSEVLNINYIRLSFYIIFLLMKVNISLLVVSLRDCLITRTCEEITFCKHQEQFAIQQCIIPSVKITLGIL